MYVTGGVPTRPLRCQLITLNMLVLTSNNCHLVRDASSVQVMAML